MSADPNPDLQRLGHCLQEARLQQGLSLEELAGRLNMGREQLESLETADSSGLPEPVFVIAQARRVACSLGLNIDGEIQALRRSESFASPAPSREVAAREPVRPSRPLRPSRPAARRTPSRIPVRALGTLALVAGLVGGGLALQQRGLVPPLALPVAPPPSSGEASTAPAPPAATAPEKPAAEAAADFAGLRLQARQPSWLEVRTASGTTLFRGTLEGAQTFPLEKGDLLVLAGRPDLIEVTVNGAEARPLGAIDKVVWQRFRAPAP